MDLRRLREETRREHEATEALLPLTSPGLELETYKAALSAMLPVVESWERWSAENAPAAVRSLLERRRRAHLLREDLATFGVETSAVTDQRVPWDSVVSGQVEGNEALTAAEFDAAFMGALYVMEGSTLGGRFIAKHVEAELSLVPGHGDAYFRGHGEATGVMWRETTAAIAAVPEEHSDRVVAAAKRTFVAFGEALRSLGKLSAG